MPDIHRRKNGNRRHGGKVQPPGQKDPDKPAEHCRFKESRRDTPAPRVLQPAQLAIGPEPPQDSQQRRSKNDREEQQHKHSLCRLGFCLYTSGQCDWCSRDSHSFSSPAVPSESLTSRRSPRELWFTSMAKKSA